MIKQCEVLNVIGIYKITNKINGKCYIGQSDNITARWQKHRKTPFNPNSRCYNYPLYRAIRKYGLENFTFEVVEECSIDELEEKEIAYIAQYNAYGDFGYNQNEGGPHARRYCRFDDDGIDAVIDRLKNSGDSIPIIAEDFDVSTSTIRSINRGEYYRRDSETYPIRKNVKITNRKITKNIDSSSARYPIRKCERPCPLELAKMIKECGFEEVGRKFGVSGKTVTKWCKFYKIPHKKENLIAWYNDQVGITVSPPKQKTPITEITKPVKQIDMKTGKVLMVFSSLGQARKAVGGTHAAHISEVCKGIRKSAYGYFWQYA